MWFFKKLKITINNRMNIFSTEFKIIQNHKSNNTFTIQLMEPNSILLKSLRYMKPSLIGLTINTSFTMASFQALSVTTLIDYKAENIVTYETTLSLISSLSTQLKYLNNKLNHTFYQYNPENVIIIDSSQFIYVSCSELMPLVEDKTIIFNYPFKKSKFSAPEILNIDTLPKKIYDKSSYYSLGMLTIYVFLSKIPKDEIEMDESLIPIKQTKLYWFLLKALNADPTKRNLLFI